MTEAAMTIRENFRRSREKSTTANAIAEIMREHDKPIQWAISRWGLTEGEARGALYAQASRATVDKILWHPKGAWEVHLRIGEKVIGHSLEQHLTKLQEDQQHVRATAERQIAQARATASRLADLRNSLASEPPSSVHRLAVRKTNDRR